MSRGRRIALSSASAFELTGASPGSCARRFICELDRGGGWIELLEHHAPYLLGDLVLRGGSVDQDAAIWLVRREREESVAQPFMERQRLAFEAVGAALAAALVGAAHALLG